MSALFVAWKQTRAERREARELAAIARAFNDRYTYRKPFVEGLDRVPGSGCFGFTPHGGHAWMCPQCNQIHHPIACSVWDGLHYPACCNRADGNRLSEGIRTK